MNITSSPESELFQRGDLHFVSPHYIIGTPQQDHIALYRINGPIGDRETHALRPLSGSVLHMALIEGAEVLRLAKHEEVVRIAELMESLSNGLTAIDHILPVDGFEDIIFALAPEMLEPTINKIEQQDGKIGSELRALAGKLGGLPSSPFDTKARYGYIVNVAAFNILNQWAKWGQSYTETHQTTDMDIAKANVMVILPEADAILSAESGGDPLLPGAQHLLSKILKQNPDSRVFASPDVAPRFEELHASGQKINIMPEVILDNIA